MKTDKHFTWLCYFLAFASAVMAEGDRLFLFIALLSFFMGISSTLEYHRVSLVWQSPDLYRHAGLYLKLADKRYRLVRFGKM